MLVASMNPCPCGFLGDPSNKCRCSIPQIHKYRSKISGPLLDRMDLQIDAPAVELSELPDDNKGETSYEVRQRVNSCRNIQKDRFKDTNIKSNASMRRNEVEIYCKLSTDSKNLFLDAMKRLNLSARAYDRILKVSRTIADLESTSNIKNKHLLEAIQYRSMDRSYL